MELLGFLFCLLIAAMVGYFYGWVKAHLTVAEECKKLGKFYVRNEVFECVKIEEKHSDDS